MTAIHDANIGAPIDRVDGPLKVRGQAHYAAEFTLPNLVHAFIVTSTIAKGRIAALDTAAAERAPGVLAVITHLNTSGLPQREEVKGTPDPEVGRPLQPLAGPEIHHNGQPIAVVVADTLEHAVAAASKVRARFQEDTAVTDFVTAAKKAFAPSQPDADKGSSSKPSEYHRGDPDAAFREAKVRIEQTYTIPAEYHNPMEMHATVASWDGAILTVYDKTQGVGVVQQQLAQALGIAKDNIRVISPFVGGAFGSGLRIWPNVILTAIAARHVGRPVKLMLTRAQMFTVTGYRPHAQQTVALAATSDGKLTAIRHDATTQTSTYEQYTETVLTPARILYACPNVRTRYQLAAMNVNTPAPMRGPGEATGLYALESALDELAWELNIDPLELRLRNHADSDPEKNKPWSSKTLKECYHRAGERFGWERRNPKPRSMREGRLLIGYGMATATWPTHRRPASVLVRIRADGSAMVQTGSADIGPGTYTVMKQIAADALGLPMDKVYFDLGDSKMPAAPVQGGSMTTASVGSAVHEACLQARKEVLDLRHGSRNAPADGESYADILKGAGKQTVEITHASKPDKDAEQYSSRAFGAQFVEVRVDMDLCTVRVARVVSAFAAGRIINPKTAHSQLIGGIIGGIGMALLEEAIWDPRNARIVNANLADYHVPVHADAPLIDAFFVEEKESHANPLGVKGIAEMSLVGLAPAIANAVYHATGKRVRDLPITPDKLL